MPETKKEWPQSWYPVCASDKLLKEKFLPVTLFDTEWIVFRGKDGRAGFVSRYCPHMGTDLNNGKVVGSLLRCPLHHWHFGCEGSCKKIPGYKDIPQEAKLKKLHCIEKYGVIFVFWGKEVLFDFPEISNFKNPIQGKVKPVSLNNGYDAITLNAFDAQHFYCVHNRTVLDTPEVISKSPYHLGIKFSAEVRAKTFYDHLMRIVGHKVLHVMIDVWGGNLIWVHNKSGKYVALLALTANGNDKSVMFLNVVKEKRFGVFGRLLQHLELSLFNRIAHTFLKPDMPVVKGMKPVNGVLLPGRDESVVTFWKYWKSLPKISKDFVEG